MNSAGANPEEVAILAPREGDADAIANVLRENGMGAETCADLSCLLEALPRCGMAVVAEEGLQSPDLPLLVEKVEAQPDWSDYPFVVLTIRGAGQERNPAALSQMRALGNVTFLERPFHPMTLVSLARTALGSRRRQYQARDRLAALEASRAAILASDERLKFALAAGRLGAWELDLRSKTLDASALCKANFGIEPEAGFTHAMLLDTIHPEDRDRTVKQVEGAIRARADFETTFRVVTPAGETRWIEVRGRASGEGSGRMTGVSVDVTERKHAEERQHLLIRELHHRVKNTLSTVQAIVGSTARGAHSIDDFYRDFTGRLQSLADTHTILTEEVWQRASLHDLIGKEVAVYSDGPRRVRFAGPPVELPSDYAVPLGMAFHELITNAARFGALSNDEGRISISWDVQPNGGGVDRVRLSWVEEDGPLVTTPKRQGFGTRLLERVLTAQVHADVGMNYDPRGLRLSLDFPLPKARGLDGAAKLS